MIEAGTVTSARRAAGRASRPLVLVPTMGALHEGHRALVRRARRAAGGAGSVAVSVFVNPTQFGPGEDYRKYPRPWQSDRELCRKWGVDIVFRPKPESMYAEDASVEIHERVVAAPFCGASRPGHFQGVCTVVAKLFNILQPDAAVFGEKDWQQLAVIRRMVRDLNFPLRILGVPTVREPDGLALSSRNRYLSEDERPRAAGLHRILTQAANHPLTASRAAKAALEKIPGVRIDYVGVADAETLGPLRKGRPARLLAAIFLGTTRLIDNVALASPNA